MTDNLYINDKPQEYNDTAEEFRREASEGDTMAAYEEITIMKTEIKEECFDSETFVEDMEFVNVKEEYIFSPDDNFENKNLDLVRSSEQLLNESVDVGNCEFRGTDLQENKYRCAICSFDFDKDIYLRNHYEQCHLKKHKLSKDNADKRYDCALCTYSTSIRSYLVKHFRCHAKDKPFKCTYKNCKCIPGRGESCECDTCDFAAITKRNLTDHILGKHSGEPKKFECSNCPYTSHRKDQLEAHFVKHSIDTPFKCIYKECKCTPEQKLLCECNTCEYAAKSKKILKRHVSLRHNFKPTNETPFKYKYKVCKCTPEQQVFCKCKSYVDKSEKEMYKCKDCNFATRSKSYLVIHSRMHTGDKPFKCKYKNCECTPEEKKSCKCDTCEFEARAEKTLKMHVLEKHSLEAKRHKCSECKYATHRKADLRLHIRSHTNERPFKCMYKNCKCTAEQEFCNCNRCSYAAKSQSHLKKHILKMHNAELKKYKSIPNHSYTYEII